MNQPISEPNCSSGDRVLLSNVAKRLSPLQALVLIISCLCSALPEARSAPEAFEVGPNNTDQLPRGKEADGIIGDFILRNNKVEAVISGNLPLRRANMSTFYGAGGVTPGCLYDLSLRGANNDQITIFSPQGQTGPVSYVRVSKDGSEGEAVIESVVSAASNNDLFRRHEYRLRDDWQGLLVTTTLRNDGKKPVKVPTGDRWTNFTRTNSMLGVHWADAVDPADKAGYAYGFVEGAPSATVELQPGATLSFSRFVAVGSSPAEALGIVAARRGGTWAVSGRVHDRNDAAVTSAAILIRTNANATAIQCLGYTDGQGQFSFRLPEGEYHLEFTDTGRASVRRTLKVNRDEKAEIEIAMDRLATVSFEIQDDQARSTPCKVQFRGIEGTPSPNLGPQNRARGCVDQYHSETGRFRVPLPPGQYKVIVTRGIEYSHIEQIIEVRSEETVQVKGTLKRLVDTTGWVSADYHNHSTPSGDNTCGTDDRIINLAAEHIEFAPTTEHNRFYDWRMYMPSKSDHPPEIDWREHSRHAKAGRSILTTGPFLQVQTEEGILPGGTARGSGGVKLKVKVQCTDWIDVDRVQVLVNGRQRQDLNFTRKSHPDQFGDGVVKFERTIDVALTQDAHLIVVAVGENFNLATGYGTSPQSRLKPFAYHNPIFVDVDGAGFTPNGDLLDWALPVKRLTVEQVRKLTSG